MARKKKADSGGGGSGDWLNTYADMVTLLLTFFILLFSMSSMDSAKFDMLVMALRSSEGEDTNTIVIKGEATGDKQVGTAAAGENDNDIIESLDEVFEALMEFIEENKLQDKVEVAKDEGIVFVRFMDDMLFQPNSAILKPEDREILNFVGVAIKSVQNEARSINIVGHTAAVPGDPNYAVSDRMLSTERANALLMYFEDDIGIDPIKMFATGMGKWQPLVPEGTELVSIDDANATEEMRGKNRRVEILINSEGNSLAEQLDNIYEQLIE